MPVEIHHELVGSIPLIWAEPAKGGAKRLAIWLSGFSGTKEANTGSLEQLTEAGFYAVSFDKFQHGERKIEPQDQIGKRVFSNFQRYAWPIIGHSADDAVKVIDWAVKRLGIEPKVSMGGISMGGDISAAAAGLDPRIVAVAATIATPDWKRPGWDCASGEPDEQAQGYYDRVCPIVNFSHYKHAPAICFENGADDKHVPPEGAHRFAKGVAEFYKKSPERLYIHDHAGVGHAFTDAMWKNSLEWFKRFGL